MLTFNDRGLLELAKRLRWFGIDRAAKFDGVWENDIVDIGYKYQMTDIAAAMGIAALDEFEQTLRYRQQLLATYERCLAQNADVTLLGAPAADETHAAWM